MPVVSTEGTAIAASSPSSLLLWSRETREVARQLALTDRQIRSCLDRVLSRHCPGTGRRRGPSVPEASSRKCRCELEPLAAQQQGGCSLTFLLRCRCCESEREIIVQIRPRRFALDVRVARDARRVLGALAPRVVWVGEVVFDRVGHGRRGGDVVEVQVVGMTRVEGVGVQRLVSVDSNCLRDWETDEERRRGTLLDGLADVFVQTWRSGSSGQHACTSLVGSSILQRLGMLQNELPTAQLRSFARLGLEAVEAGGLELLPVVLNHGDLIPRNILVDPLTWKLTGLIDWAEAEYLPFGMTLYGVEHLLGNLVEGEDGSARKKFVYRPQARTLRNRFLRRVRREIPELKDASMWRAVMLSRDIGILLWHGIAWNDGKRNRVVDCRPDDIGDLAYLEGFYKMYRRSLALKL